MVHSVACYATLCKVVQGYAINLKRCLLQKILHERLVELEIDIGIVLAIVSIGLSLAGAKYVQWKSKAKQLKKTVDLLVDATEDDKVSEEEFQKVVNLAKQILSGDSEE